MTLCVSVTWTCLNKKHHRLEILVRLYSFQPSCIFPPLTLKPADMYSASLSEQAILHVMPDKLSFVFFKWQIRLLWRWINCCIAHLCYALCAIWKYSRAGTRNCMAKYSDLLAYKHWVHNVLSADHFLKMQMQYSSLFCTVYLNALLLVFAFGLFASSHN